MELKAYQRRVIGDLTRYLELLDVSERPSEAFRALWDEQCAPSLGEYHKIIEGVPCVCLKVPTGGGKTFIAAASVRPIFDHFADIRRRAVVWLVPSESILTQTLRDLKDPEHQYRQRLAADFSGRVEVYGKQELLAGQNFNQTSVLENLSVMVLSYDSFKNGRSVEARKAYQDNSVLAGLAQSIEETGTHIENADELSLIQTINRLSPIVIVDESHHARTQLSLDMLRAFNPSFVLELSATPTKRSNVISYVDASELKREQMVKLPVIVYNRSDIESVYADAIDMRRHLEACANEELKETGRYIRPIVLLQAQPNSRTDSETFERVRGALLKLGIPADQIAIRTSEINELKGVDLLSEKCAVRFIITVDALKEGWDCPFAYILASIANKSSLVSVEQILGRVLRQPQARRCARHELNLSYVLTSSSDFHATLERVQIGLVNAGFTEREYRSAQESSPDDEIAPVVAEQRELYPPAPEPVPETPSEDEDDDVEVDINKVAEKLRQAANAEQMSALAARVDDEIQQEEENEEFTLRDFPIEVRQNMNVVKMKKGFVEETKELLIPQFMLRVPGLFGSSEEELEPLSKRSLSIGFDLKVCDVKFAFDATDAQMASIDVQDADEGRANIYSISKAEREYLLNILSRNPKSSKIKHCRKHIVDYLNSTFDDISYDDLNIYVSHILDTLDDAHADDMLGRLTEYGRRIERKIKDMLTDYQKQNFDKWRNQGRIVCEPYYKLPSMLPVGSSASTYGRSLYEHEYGITTNIEKDLALHLSGMSSVRWWHKINERKKSDEFSIRGFINHYPDFMVMTNKGMLILVETKGAQLVGNADTYQKIELGTAWASDAGKKYRYFMVIEDGMETSKGCLKMSDLLDVLEAE